MTDTISNLYKCIKYTQIIIACLEMLEEGEGHKPFLRQQAFFCMHSLIDLLTNVEIDVYDTLRSNENASG
jgi:hypothetical protein